LAADKLESVKEYYGKTLTGKRDLKSGACCSADSLPPHQKRALELIHDEILDKFYGCGSPIPSALEGCTVLDLGCGTGRDTFMAAFLAGPQGRAIGVDMTDEQLEVAQRHVAQQTERFGFARPNVVFKKGYIEALDELGIEDNSVDIVISNCVINLSPGKPRVFREIQRVLRPGGELCFSDIFAGRRVPVSVRDDPELYGECLGGALYIEDFRRLMQDIGWLDYRMVSQRRIDLGRAGLEEKAGMVDFYSMTVRVFNLDTLEDICEDYGQTAVYHGTIAGSPHRFTLDDHHTFFTDKPMLVCGNTASMLQDTRYAKHFDVKGDRGVHYGPFECGAGSSKVEPDDGNAGGACC
jgi:SAM-dependent methyltransferase